MAMRSALTRYFKKERNLDIIKNELFIKASSMFVAMTKVNKEAGLGDVESYLPIEDADMHTLTAW